MRTGSISLRIDSRLDEVFLIGLAVRAIAGAASLDDEQAAAMELCVVEAVNNCIEHAYREEPGHPVEVVLTLTAAELRIEVRDRGRTMDWAAARARAVAAAAGLAEGGRGLLIIEALTDAVGYAVRGNANVLTLSKRLPAVEAA